MYKFDRWSNGVLFVRLFFRYIPVKDTCQVGIIGRGRSVFNFWSNFELGSILMTHVIAFVVGRKHFCQRRFQPILWLLPGLFRRWGLSVPINILFWFGIGLKLLSSHLTIEFETKKLKPLVFSKLLDLNSGIESKPKAS